MEHLRQKMKLRWVVQRAENGLRQRRDVIGGNKAAASGPKILAYAADPGRERSAWRRLLPREHDIGAGTRA